MIGWSCDEPGSMSGQSLSAVILMSATRQSRYGDGASGAMKDLPSLDERIPRGACPERSEGLRVKGTRTRRLRDGASIARSPDHPICPKLIP